MSKIALVTGASRGIGRAVALGLAELGYQLVLNARDKSKLEEVAAEITRRHPSNGQSLVQVVDVTDKAQVDKAVAEVIAKFGKIDVLFNNAGIARLGTTDIAYEDAQAVMQTNFFGAFHYLSAAAPQMQKQRAGYIFNLASMAGKRAGANIGIYAASKFALNGLNESLFNLMAKYDVKVTSICPSFIDTDMTAGMSLASVNPSLSKETMSNELKIQTEDVVKTVQYLLTLSAAACVKEMVIDCKITI